MEVKFKGRLERRRPGAVGILKRIVTVASGGLENEADQRHAQILMKDMGVDEGSKGIITRGGGWCWPSGPPNPGVNGRRTCFYPAPTLPTPSPSGGWGRGEGG